MVTVFANNQVMVTNAGARIIDTDPLPMNGNDRIQGVLNIHYIYGTNAALGAQAYASNDGQNWVTVGSAESENSAGAVKFTLLTSVLYAFVKYQFSFNSDDAGAVCFDLHSVNDHS